MKDWQETSTGFIRNRPDGTLDRHPHKYVAHERFVFRATYDAAGQCMRVEHYPQKAYLLYDQDGEIKAVNVGFNLHAELNGTHPFGEIPDGHAVAEIAGTLPCPHCGGVENPPMAELLPPDFEQNIDTDIVYVDESGDEIRREPLTTRRIAYRWHNGALARKDRAELEAPVVRSARAKRNSTKE